MHNQKLDDSVLVSSYIEGNERSLEILIFINPNSSKRIQPYPPRRVRSFQQQQTISPQLRFMFSRGNVRWLPTTRPSGGSILSSLVTTPWRCSRQLRALLIERTCSRRSSGALRRAETRSANVGRSNFCAFVLRESMPAPT